MNISAKAAATDIEIHGNFVDGREIEAGAGQMLDVRNPATGDVIARIPNSTRSRPIWRRCTGWKPSTTAVRSTRPARSCRGCRTFFGISPDLRSHAATR